MKVEFGKIELSFIKSPFIVYLDMFYLGNNIHSPHFVVIEGRRKGKLVIVDPWKGKKFLMEESSLVESVDSLRRYLKFCPILLEFL